MFDKMNKQHLADMFLNALPSSKEKKVHQRLGAVYAIQRFEKAHWLPDAFQKAVDELPAGSISISENQVEGSPEDIAEVLQRYIEIVEEWTGVPAIENEFFTLRSAAWYIARKLNQRGISITPRGVDLHLRGTDELVSTLQVGKSNLYTRQQLDEYTANFKQQPRFGREPNKAIEN